MKCDNCGSPLKVVPQRKYLACDYCGTFKFTPDADGGTPLQLSDGQTDRACPICQELLARAALAGKEVLTCRTCRGILSENRAFADIVRLLRARSRRRTEGQAAIDPAELARTVLCPGCGKPMEAHPYYGPGAVVVDSCARCHLIWLDHGELAAIETAPGR